MTIYLSYFFYTYFGDYMEVYIDVVILLNFLIDLILILSVALILRRKTNIKKIIKGSLIGGVSILALFLGSNRIVLILIKLITSFLIVVTSFGFRNIGYTIKNMIYLYISSIFLGGTLYMLNLELCYNNEGMIFYHNNMTLNYLILLVVTPIVIYLYIKESKNLKNNYSNYYNIDIYLKDGTKKSMTGYLDTGNKLKDPYKHRPIILVNSKVLDINYLDTNVLLVPYDTLNNHGLLRCIIPDKIYIDNIGYKYNYLIGISNEEIKIDGIDCILHSKLLERGIE